MNRFATCVLITTTTSASCTWSIDFVHVMYDGRIVKGRTELVGELEAKGYGWIGEEVAARA